MYELLILNLENNEKFIKKFNSYYLMEQFKKKCKYSKKVKIISEMKEGI